MRIQLLSLTTACLIRSLRNVELELLAFILCNMTIHEFSGEYDPRSPNRDKINVRGLVLHQDGYGVDLRLCRLVHSVLKILCISEQLLDHQVVKRRFPSGPKFRLHPMQSERMHRFINKQESIDFNRQANLRASASIGRHSFVFLSGMINSGASFFSTFLYVVGRAQ